DDRNEEEFILDGRDVAIGRAPSCDIVLHGDQLASRRHALLRNKGRHYTAVDLGSSNGTYLNDLEIREEVVLHDGDCLKVGSHELVYSTTPASPNASLAGVRMSGPLPPAPLPETNPSMESIQIAPYPPTSAPAPEQPFILVSSAPLAPAPTEDAAPPADAPAQPLPEPSLPTAESYNGATADARMSVVDEVELSADERPSSNLDQLRTQLNEVGAVLSQVADASAALARKADDEARAADQLRASLAGMRDSVVAILMEPPRAANEPDPALEELIGIARQTAENPRHLDYVTTLAAHASQVADALEATRYAADAARMRVALETLRAELDDVLK
ncbi:MAG TPA: FHA domain-containing protein, partial [Ktedonobacterales bacterium]|nr:FHA domain-containing protein [Ktedonobacterales bacterium]